MFPSVFSDEANVERPPGHAYSSGDSWRAKAQHMWELQVNIASGALRIDFPGQSNAERMRNYAQIGEGVSAESKGPGLIGSGGFKVRLVFLLLPEARQLSSLTHVLRVSGR